MSVKQLELADRISSMLGARATWLVPAGNTVDVIAKIGLMGPADRLVAFADDFPEAFDSAALAGRVVMVDDPSPASFISASGWIAYDAEEDLTGWGDRRSSARALPPRMPTPPAAPPTACSGSFPR